MEWIVGCLGVLSTLAGVFVGVRVAAVEQRKTEEYKRKKEALETLFELLVRCMKRSFAPAEDWYRVRAELQRLAREKKALEQRGLVPVTEDGKEGETDASPALEEQEARIPFLPDGKMLEEAKQQFEYCAMRGHLKRKKEIYQVLQLLDRYRLGGLTDPLQVFDVYGETMEKVLWENRPAYSPEEVKWAKERMKQAIYTVRQEIVELEEEYRPVWPRKNRQPF
ncbi:hypothetical protein GCM10011571_03330 [Marinithermofilum abyssi]|uniref:Uncharacterized protein n=1 Tax=Marinithermofilum abyssi TaxID=1571185 RepID=A0A8J2VG23_9BACL|nr:hypothetical protein [Marinithermofilum abyssi]GGE05587.1 hypothetical protein GCM10011571_03330 [Marinithermofilum abyssi]